MSLVYFLIAIAAVVGAYLLLFRQNGAWELPSRWRRPTLPPKSRPAETEPDSEQTPKGHRAASEAEEGKEAETESPPPAKVEPTPAPELRSEAAPRAEPAMAAEIPAAKLSPAARPRHKQIEELRRGLAKSRSDEGLFGRLKSLFTGGRELSPELISELEEVLLSSDVGFETTQRLIEKVKGSLKKSELSDPERVWSALREEANSVLLASGPGGGLKLHGHPTVVLMVGVNGVGKTTTIGKLAARLRASGKKCVLAAGDTFRAAAVQQLLIWGDRVGCEVVHGKDGADPGSVVFDAIRRAQETSADVVLADTAGRLHTKVNLMAEMKKIAKTAEKALPGAPHEVLLVIDATTGQNALAQAREFQEALALSGVILTKLDGTAKGGIVLAIANTLNLPVRFVGLGERLDDLHEFSSEDFVEALFGRESVESA